MEFPSREQRHIVVLVLDTGEGLTELLKVPAKNAWGTMALYVLSNDLLQDVQLRNLLRECYLYGFRLRKSYLISPYHKPQTSAILELMK